MASGSMVGRKIGWLFRTKEKGEREKENGKDDGAEERRTGLHNNPNSLSAQSSYNLLSIFILLPSLSSIPSSHLAVIVELNSMFARFRVAREPHQGNSFVDFYDGAIERGSAADIEIEYLRTRLVADGQEILLERSDRNRGLELDG